LFAIVGALALIAGGLLPLPVTEVLVGLSLKIGANSAKATPPINPPSVTYNPDRNPSTPWIIAVPGQAPVMAMLAPNRRPPIILPLYQGRPANEEGERV
jgi:hypothetical protein